MGKLAAGSIVLVNFPFSNLKGAKLRPALVLAVVEFDNLILCQITSKPYSSKTAVRIEKADFLSGSLPVTSFVRPDKLFTADSTIIKAVAGKLKTEAIERILLKVKRIF